jgi:hypothetical protein
MSSVSFNESGATTIEVSQAPNAVLKIQSVDG